MNRMAREGGLQVKNSIAVLVMVIVGLAVVAQANDFSGPVEMIEEWVYETEVRFGSTVEVWVSHTLNTYDIEGNLIEKAEYSSSGILIEREVHSYDSSSCNIESVYYNSSGTIDRRVKSQCDSTGRAIVTERYDRNGRMTYRILTEYQGRLKRSRGYEADGTLTAAIDTETDDFGNITRTIFYDEETGSVSSVIRYTYTSDGKTLGWFYYGEDENLLDETRYSYSYGEDGMDEITTNTSFLLGYQYHSEVVGTVIEMDAFGNWTEKRSYEQETSFGQLEWILTDIVRRSITYR